MAGYLSATNRNKACGSRELARVTKSSFPRSLSRSYSRRCPVVADAAAANEAAEKCFRTNWRALIDEATESFPRNRGSSKGLFIVASHRREATVLSRDAWKAQRRLLDNADKPGLRNRMRGSKKKKEMKKRRRKGRGGIGEGRMWSRTKEPGPWFNWATEN